MRRLFLIPRLALPALTRDSPPVGVLSETGTGEKENRAGTLKGGTIFDLVIAEKPSVAQTIAAVLGAKEKKDGFLTGSGYIVSWCVGTFGRAFRSCRLRGTV